MATQTDQNGIAAGWSGQIEAAPEFLDSHTPLLWAGAVLSYVGGDLVTTVVGLRYTALVEVGPLATVLLAESGFEALVGLKLGLVGLLVVVWKLVPRPVSVGIPLGLTIVGSTITLWNGILITLMLG